MIGEDVDAAGSDGGSGYKCVPLPREMSVVQSIQVVVRGEIVNHMWYRRSVPYTFSPGNEPPCFVLSMSSLLGQWGLYLAINLGFKIVHVGKA